MKSKRILRMGWCLTTLTGCATVAPKADYEQVAQRIEAAIGEGVAVDPEGHLAIQARIDELLADGITAGDAVQLSLLNNPKLQAGLLRIGVGRAAFVQAGLFSNPGLALSLRFPDDGGLANFEVSLAQNIAELWQIKSRKRAAERDLDQTILSVAREASTVALGARSAYIRAVQADREAALAKENLAIAEQLVEAAVARVQAGSGTGVDVNLARAERVSLDVKARVASVAAVGARAELGKLLGLTVPPSELALTEALPEPRELPFDAARVVEESRSHRLDLRAATAVVDAAQARVAYERSRVFKNVEVGVSMERSERRSRGDRNWLSDTAWASAEAGSFTLPSLQPRDPVPTDYVTGPTLAMELPLFDQNQAQIARAEYELLAASYLRESIEREIVQDSWAAYARAQTAFENAKFMRDELLPLGENGLKLAREAFRVGSTTILTVLDAQRTLLEARTGYVRVQADAALATIDLERVAGRPFSALVDTTQAAQEKDTEGKP